MPSTATTITCWPYLPPKLPPSTPPTTATPTPPASPDQALDKLQTGRWKLPLGSLVIVDDADHLKPDQLHWLAENAAATNTKLLLITTPDHRQPAHTLHRRGRPPAALGPAARQP